MNFPEELLDEKEQYYIKNMLLEGINFATKQPAGKDPERSRLMITDLGKHTGRELNKA